MIGAIEIRYSDENRVAEHEATRNMFRHLVNGRRGVHLRARHRLNQNSIENDRSQ